MRLPIILILFIAPTVLTGVSFRFSGSQHELGPVDWFGYATLERNLADVKLPGGRNIPLRVRFSSNPEWHSDHLGAGWNLPLLESTIYPHNDYNLKLSFIDGKEYYLGRGDRKSSTYDNADGDISAAVKDKWIKVTHTDGWKANYRNGLLNQLHTPEGDELRYLYRDGRVTNIRLADGTDLVKILSDWNEPCIREIRLGSDKTFELHSGRHDEIKSRMSTRYGKGLYQIIDSESEDDAGTTRYSFKPIDHGGVEMIVIEGEDRPQPITWDAKTGHIRSSGKWNYQITPKKNKWEYAKIERTHTDGRKEMINRDFRKGLRERLYSDGRLETKHFTIADGPLHWKLRKVTETVDSTTAVLAQHAYYDDGNLLRSIDKAGNIKFFERDEQDRLKRVFFNDQLIEEREYTCDGDLLSRSLEIDGKWIRTEYRPDGQEVKRSIDGQLEWYNQYDGNDRLTAQIFRSGFQRKWIYGKGASLGEFYKLTLWPDGKRRIEEIEDYATQTAYYCSGKKATYSDGLVQGFQHNHQEGFLALSKIITEIKNNSQ